MVNIEWLSGWWYVCPSEKWWSSSVGMTFPIYEKIIQMFQTTNQRFEAFTIEKNRWISQMARFGHPFVAYPCGSMATVWEGTANPLIHTPVPIPKKGLGSVQCGGPRSIAKLVYNCNFTMVYDTRITVVTGVYKPTYFPGGPHGM